MKRYKRRRPPNSEWFKLNKAFCMAVVTAENFLHKYFHYRKEVSTSGRFLSCEGKRVRIRKSGVPAKVFTFTVWAWADPRNAPKSFKIPAVLKDETRRDTALALQENCRRILNAGTWKNRLP